MVGSYLAKQVVSAAMATLKEGFGCLVGLLPKGKLMETH